MAKGCILIRAWPFQLKHAHTLIMGCTEGVTGVMPPGRTVVVVMEAVRGEGEGVEVVKGSKEDWELTVG